MRCERSIQPAAVQLRISPTPHSLFDDVAGAIDGGFGQHAKRVAVQIDDACGIDAIERERGADGASRIARVLIKAVVPP